MGRIFKTARLSANLTQEALAEKIGVTARYIMALENEGKRPGIDNFLRLVHTLNIPADAIIYPEQNSSESENEQFYRMFQMLNYRDKKIICATIKEMLNNR